jgi:hypothetical protein
MCTMREIGEQCRQKIRNENEREETSRRMDIYDQQMRTHGATEAGGEKGMRRLRRKLVREAMVDGERAATVEQDQRERILSSSSLPPIRHAHTFPSLVRVLS